MSERPADLPGPGRAREGRGEGEGPSRVGQAKCLKCRLGPLWLWKPKRGASETAAEWSHTIRRGTQRESSRNHRETDAKRSRPPHPGARRETLPETTASDGSRNRAEIGRRKGDITRYPLLCKTPSKNSLCSSHELVTDGVGLTVTAVTHNLREQWPRILVYNRSKQITE